MARRLRSLTVKDIERFPTECAGCSFWESAGERPRVCGSVSDLDLLNAWYRRVTDEWGECGQVAYENDEVLGFIKYAPSGYFPQAATFAASPKDPSVPLIACLHILPEARHHGLGSVLLRAAFKDLLGKGERKVEAFATAKKPVDIDTSPLMSMDFLLRNGFTVAQPDLLYPLLKLDLRSIVAWSDNLDAVLESLRFPLRAPSRAPATWMNGNR